MPSEWAKDVVPGGTSATSEYSFYTGVRSGGTYAYSALSPEERTLYSLLEAKVAYGGVDSLNKKALQSSGTIYNKANSSAYQRLGERLNPVIVKDINEAQARIGSARLETTDHSNNKKLPTGLYRDTALNNYYFVIGNKKEKKVSNVNGSGLNTYTLNPLNTQVDPIVHNPISFPKAKGVKPPKDDLIFNSADYQSTYEEAITQMSLALIASGDDIISDYSYESIDSLPDYDVEIMISGGEYLNAKEVIEKGLLGGDFQSLIDDSTSSEDVEKANRLLEYLEGKIGLSVSYSDLLQYFGSFNADNVTFNSGVKKRNTDSSGTDFYIEIPDEYQIAGVNEVRVRFDLI